MTKRKRIGVFGWGLVAPKSPNIEAFEQNLERSDTWLSPFRGYGQSNFLVRYPEFDFETYHGWFEGRFPPAKFSQIKDKESIRMNHTTLAPLGLAAFMMSAVACGGSQPPAKPPAAAKAPAVSDKEVSDKEMAAFDKTIDQTSKKLSNPDFVARAPEEVIEENRERLDDAMGGRTKLSAALERLKAAL